MEENEKMQALQNVLMQIEKKHGKGSVMRLGEIHASYDEDAISTGAVTLDIAIGIGGVPRGRIVEIFGPESSGKTTLALQIVAQAQKNNGIAAYIDVENALDPEYAKKLGVDVDNLYISQPDTGEQALEIADTLINSHAVDIIIVDSVAALVPKTELEGEMGESHVGLQARLMSQALRKLTGSINRSRTCAIFINQIREKIGVPTYGGIVPETTPGGRALKFYSSLRMDIRKGEAIKNGGEQIGNRVRIKIVKNKMAPPFRHVECDMIYGEGISGTTALLDCAVEYGIVKKSGSWFTYGELKLGQGTENVRKLLTEKPELLQEITSRTREAAGLPVEKV